MRGRLRGRLLELRRRLRGTAHPVLRLLVLRRLPAHRLARLRPAARPRVGRRLLRVLRVLPRLLLRVRLRVLRLLRRVLLLLLRVRLARPLLLRVRLRRAGLLVLLLRRVRLLHRRLLDGRLRALLGHRRLDGSLLLDRRLRNLRRLRLRGRLLDGRLRGLLGHRRLDGSLLDGGLRLRGRLLHRRLLLDGGLLHRGLRDRRLRDLRLDGRLLDGGLLLHRGLRDRRNLGRRHLLLHGRLRLRLRLRRGGRSARRGALGVPGRSGVVRGVGPVIVVLGWVVADVDAVPIAAHWGSLVLAEAASAVAVGQQD
uniref:hypothetical protein n=1 Tax=Kitasatospora setae TaxID=2066 RepID=UPI0038B31AA3